MRESPEPDSCESGADSRTRKSRNKPSPRCSAWLAAAGTEREGGWAGSPFSQTQVTAATSAAPVATKMVDEHTFTPVADVRAQRNTNRKRARSGDPSQAGVGGSGTRASCLVASSPSEPPSRVARVAESPRVCDGVGREQRMPVGDSNRALRIASRLGGNGVIGIDDSAGGRRRWGSSVKADGPSVSAVAVTPWERNLPPPHPDTIKKIVGEYMEVNFVVLAAWLDVTFRGADLAVGVQRGQLARKGFYRLAAFMFMFPLSIFLCCTSIIFCRVYRSIKLRYWLN